jgi:hypothetical protein
MDGNEKHLVTDPQQEQGFITYLLILFITYYFLN